MPILGDGKYGSYEINKRFNVNTQLLCSYSLTFKFTTPSGILDYLNGKIIKLPNIPLQSILTNIMHRLTFYVCLWSNIVY